MKSWRQVDLTPKWHRGGWDLLEEGNWVSWCPVWFPELTVLHPSGQHRYHRCKGIKMASFLNQKSPGGPRLTAGAHSLIGLRWSELCPFLHGQPPLSARGLSMGHFPERTQRHYPPCERKPADSNSSSWLWRKMPSLSPDRLSRAAILFFQSWADFRRRPLSRGPPVPPVRRPRPRPHAHQLSAFTAARVHRLQCARRADPAARLPPG